MMHYIQRLHCRTCLKVSGRLLSKLQLIIYLEKSLLCLFFLVLILSKAQSQTSATSTFSQDTVTIGDPITIEIKIRVPNDAKVDGIDMTPFLRMENKVFAQDTNFLDKIADVEVLDWGNWKHTDMSTTLNSSEYTVANENGQQVISNTIKIAIYNMGVFTIPAPGLKGQFQDSVMSGASKTIIVKLPESIMAQDSIPFNPIYDIMKEEANLSDYLLYIYILIGILVLALIGYYFYRLKNKEKLPIVIETPIIILSAHEKATKALQVLDEKQLWQQGFIKDYQSELTDIMRQYLSDRFHVKAQEMTTDEITQALSTLDYDSENTGNLREILQIADLVKFAKALPDDDVHTRFMQKAYTFIEKTKKSES